MIPAPLISLVSEIAAPVGELLVWRGVSLPSFGALGWELTQMARDGRSPGPGQD